MTMRTREDIVRSIEDEVARREQSRADLRTRLYGMNAEADAAMAAFSRHREALRRLAGGDEGRFHVLKRDDLRLRELADDAMFFTAVAGRLAATLQCELLSALLSRGGQ